MDAGGGLRIEVAELRVGGRGALGVVELLPAQPGSGGSRRRQLEVCERGPQVEPGSSHHHRCPLGHSRRDSALAAGGGAEDRNHRANHDPAIVRFTEAALKKFLRRDLTLPGLLRRNHLERTHFEVLFFVAWSGGLALAALIGVAWVAGFGRVIGRLDEINPIWFAVAFGAEVLAYVGY